MIQFIKIENSIYPISTVKYRAQKAGDREQTLVIADKLYTLNMSLDEFMGVLDWAMLEFTIVLDLDNPYTGEIECTVV